MLACTSHIHFVNNVGTFGYSYDRLCSAMHNSFVCNKLDCIMKITHQ